MSEHPEDDANSVLVILRRVERKLDRMLAKQDEINARLTQLDEKLDLAGVGLKSGSPGMQRH